MEGPRTESGGASESRVLDPARQLIEAEQDALVDFIFRLTSDRSRASVMAREACLQVVDELRSGMSGEDIRAFCYQRAYELSEEALRPFSTAYLKDYYRLQHSDYQTLSRFYRWELFLLEMGPHAATLLLLEFRYGLSLERCALVLGREDLQEESAALQSFVAAQGGLDLRDLKLLPRYGFLSETYGAQTALSRVMRHFKVPETPGILWLGLGVLLVSVVVGYGLGVMLWRYLKS